MRRIRLVAVSLVVAVAAAIAAAVTYRGEELMVQPIAAQPKAGQLNLDGHWQSRGYGWIWSIRGKRIATYDVADRYCVGDDDSRSTRERGLSLRLDVSGQVLRVIDGDESYEYLFDRLDERPRVCGQSAGAGPLAVLDAVDGIFSAHYPFFERRGVDWPALMDAARAQVSDRTDAAQLFHVLTETLLHVPDDHVSLSGTVAGRDLRFSFEVGRTRTAAAAQAAREDISLAVMMRRWRKLYWNQGVAKTLLSGRGRTAANDMIQYGLIDGDIGYLNVRSLEGFAGKESRDTAALDKALDAALDLFGGARAVIVDVTFNEGGYDHLARQLARRFASERTLIYSKFAGDDPQAVPQAVYIEPADRVRFTGPVYLLTSELTVSAAEILAMAMRALPNVVHVGETTRGSLSDILSKPLPNGWWIGLSNEVYRDADGIEWEGRGIPPEIEIAVFSKADVTHGHVEAVGAVVDLIRHR